MGKGGGSAQQQVTDYYLSLHLGVCAEVDSVTGIYVDNKTLWEGDASVATVLPINLPNLNGGPKEQGGVVGNVYVLPGRSDQVLPDDLAGRMNNGQPGLNTPGFRGLTTLFFAGAPSITDLGSVVGDFFADLATPFRGFKWSSNNPIVAQNLSARVKRAPKGLDPSIAMMSTTVEVVTVTHVDSDNNSTQSQYVVGTDASSIQTFEGDTTSTTSKVVNLANPAHIIFEAMTNTAWGMGTPTAMFDMDGWGSAAQQLYDEGLGLSMMWAKQSTIKDFVNKVLDHIQGVVFVDPETGLWNLTLIRADYVVGALPVFDPSNAVLKGYSQKSWGETINEIAVNWTNPLNEETATVLVQDLANISIQGATVSDTRDYVGVRTAELATKLGARDLRAAAAPLRSMELEVDRSAWNLRPGKCIVVNWPEKRVTGAVMRIMKIDRGKKGSPAIKLTLLEDIFSLDHAVITPAPGSAWVDPTEAPSPIDNVSIITLPAFLALTADFQGAQIDLEYPEVRAMVLGYKQSQEVNDYDLYTPQTDSTGTSSFKLAGTKSIVERSLLPADLAAEAGSVISNRLVSYPNRGPIVSGFVWIGNGDSDYEIAMVSDTSGGNIALQRGVLDTVPKAWPAGTPIWFTNIGQRLVDEAVIRSAGETVQYKLSPRTNIGALALSDATTFSQALTARPYLPLRPANVKVNGHGFGPVAIGSSTNLAVTWSTRNRTLEDGEALLWNVGPVAPEYRQGTVVTVTDVSTSTVVYEQAGLWTEDDLSMPAAWFARYTDIDIKVSSRKDDLDSLQGHVIRVTGLPGNLAADPPPAPPALTEPPSPAPAPDAGSWGVFGTSISGLDGSAIPAIQIAGTPDVASAEDLIIQYRINGDEVWTTWPLVALKHAYVSVYVTGLLANTLYDVRIAYQLAYGPDGTILTQWLDMGSVTTGAGVSSDAAALGGRIAHEVLALIDGAVAEGAALLASLQDTIAQAEAQAEDQIAAVMLSARIHGYLENLTYLNGEPIGPVVRQQQLISDGLISTQSLIAIKSATGDTMDLQLSTLIVDPLTGETLGERFTSLTAHDNDNSAALNTEQLVRAAADTAESTSRLALAAIVSTNSATIISNFSTLSTANSATASELHLLGAQNGSHTAFDINTATATYDGVQSIATHNSGVTSSLASNSAAIASEVTARSTAISSEASARLALASTVGSNSSSITFILSALGGNQATAILALDVGGHVTGFTVNGATSQFAIVASQFAVVDPGGGSPTSPIVYSGGVIYLNTAVYAQSIVAASITTGHLVGGAVNGFAYAGTSPVAMIGTTPTDILDLPYTNTAGGPVVVSSQISIFNPHSDGARGVDAQIFRDGSAIGPPLRFAAREVFLTTSPWHVVDIGCPPGYHVYSVYIWCEQTDGVRIDEVDAWCIEFKNAA